MYEMIKSLVEIGEGLGVKFRYKSPVAQIDVESSRASGVTLEDGQRLDADIVVANADLPYVYSELLPDDGTAARLAKKKYSSSAFMFYWGIKGERSPELLHHNVFLADHRYLESFDRIFRDLTLPDDPSFYVCAPSRTDSRSAPTDGDSLLVLVPVGHINDEHPQDWESLRNRARETVLSRLGAISRLDNLADKMVLEEMIGPSDYLNHLNLAKGAAFGLSHSFFQVGYMRPHNRHKHYKNLYFVGASTHPGTGLPIVLISARLLVERILTEQAVPERPVSIYSRMLRTEK
jgi:phytoene desaturase